MANMSFADFFNQKYGTNYKSASEGGNSKDGVAKTYTVGKTVEVSHNPFKGVAETLGVSAVEGTKQAYSGAKSFTKTSMVNSDNQGLENAYLAVQNNISYPAYNTMLKQKYKLSGDSINYKDKLTPEEYEMAVSAFNRSRLGIVDMNDWQSRMNKQTSDLAAIDSERRAANAASQAKLQAVDDKYQLGKVGEFATDVAGAAGQMAPSLALGMINPALGLGTLGTQVAAQSYGQAMDSGATHEEAMAYGALEGLKEASIEKLVGGMGKAYGGGLLDNALLKTRANDSLKNVAINTAKGMTGEGAEEALAGYLDPIIERATYNPDAQNATAEELAYQAAIGAALGGIMGGGSNLVGYGASRRANKPQQSYNNISEAVAAQEKPTQQGEIEPQRAQNAETINYTTEEVKPIVGQNNEAGAVADVPQLARDKDMLQDVSNMPQEVSNMPQEVERVPQEVAENVGQSKYRIVPAESVDTDVRRFIDRATGGGVAIPKEYIDAPDNIKGFIENGKMYINANKMNDAAQVKATVAHELFHAMENTKEGADIYRLALEASGMNEADLLQAKKEQYSSITTLDDNGARAEVAAEFIEKAFADEATIDRIVNTNPNLALRILEKIKAMITAFKAKRGLTAAEKAEYNRLQKARDLYEQGYKKLRSGEYRVNAELSRNAYDMPMNNTRYSLEDLAEQYGVKKPGAEPRRDVVYPEATSDFDKTRSFGRTAMERENLDEGIYQRIESSLESDIADGRFVYEPTSNEKNLKRARKAIDENGMRESYQGFKANFAKGNRVTSEDIATAEMLLLRASEAGDVDTAIDLVGMLATLGTEYGQAIQAMSLLKKMTPAGYLKQAENIRKRLMGKYPNADIKPFDKRDVEVLLNQKTEQGLEDQLGYMITKLSDDLPANIWDKLNAWRYLAMLGNVRTHLRNILGNAANYLMQAAKNQTAGTIERATLKEGERTKAVGFVSKDLKDYARSNFESEGKKLVGYQNKYETTDYDRQVFNSKILNTASKFNQDLMELEDMMFKQKAYISALAGYMKANKYTPEMLESDSKLRQKATKYAAEQAKRVTFQQASELANAISRFERKEARNRGEKAAQIAVGATLPFKRTPINIAKESLSFSPLGLMRAVSTSALDLKNGKISANEFIDRISAGLVGSSIMALGAWLGALGLVTTGYDREKAKENNYNTQMGEQNYAIMLPGGGSYTIDWLAPTAVPFLMGAELVNSLGEDESSVQSIYNAMLKSANPILEMSFVQGLQNTLQSYASGTEGIGNIAQATVEGYLGQFVPTMLGQIARSIDETKRTTYAPKDSAFQSGEKFVRTQANKIPFASMTSEPAVNVWGEERKQEGENIFTRAMFNMLSPGTYSSNKKTAVDEEINRLFDSTGEVAVIPKSAEKSITFDDKTYQLSASDYTAFQKSIGQNNKKDLEKLIKSKAYKQMDEAQQIEAIKDIYSYNTYKAKEEYLQKRGVNYSNSTYESLKNKREVCDKYGIDLGTFTAVDNTINTLRKANSGKYNSSSDTTAANKRDIAEYLAKTDLTNPQRQAIWATIYKDKYIDTARKYGF